MNTDFSILSTFLLFLFVIDPFGNIPILLSVMKGVPQKRQYTIVARDGVIGLVILVAFLYFGAQFMQLLHLETESISIAGGVVLFVIALKMIFPSVMAKEKNAVIEPFIVPISIPMLAGPSTLATLLVMVKSYPSDHGGLLVSVVCAWGVSVFVLMMAPMLNRLLKEKGLAALERLMGMLLLMMSVQMIVNGVRSLFTHTLSALS
ncbi:MarC family protein [Marinomonas flavescens]|uniref:MarC family protein n=1 Tax=Marinomonas flavescens TaxID=2529379 RepID=UPI00105673F7|nr:MarC family protein [Marinomonas flavescens]